MTNLENSKFLSTEIPPIKSGDDRKRDTRVKSEDDTEHAGWGIFIEIASSFFKASQ